MWQNATTGRENELIQHQTIAGVHARIWFKTFSREDSSMQTLGETPHKEAEKKTG